jgi:hypothetical protein
MTIAIHVDVPIACFRQSRAREYAETTLYHHPQLFMECYSMWAKQIDINTLVSNGDCYAGATAGKIRL